MADAKAVQIAKDTAARQAAAGEGDKEDVEAAKAALAAKFASMSWNTNPTEADFHSK